MTASELYQWLPDARTVAADLLYDQKEKMSIPTTGNVTAVGECNMKSRAFFDADVATLWFSRHWEVPILACAAYLVLIPALRAHVARRGKPYDTRRFALWWNIFLSLFSVIGFSACGPTLVSGLWHQGLHFTICENPCWYGLGWTGLWVFFFNASKIFELVDTALLLLSGRPVILLHWWHHFTVLLYCWHAYASRNASGAWYSAMNYGVHSLMYAYFAATQHGQAARRAVRPYAIYITVLQLTQMIVGIAVTVTALATQVKGGVCSVNRTNLLLALLMYMSYFVLFLKLFLEHYVFKETKKLK